MEPQTGHNRAPSTHLTHHQKRATLWEHGEQAVLTTMTGRLVWELEEAEDTSI